MRLAMRATSSLAILALGLLGLVPPAASQPTLKGNSWAVVVGINDYMTAQRLRFAVADASAVADLLTRQGFTVKALYNQQATRANILREIGTNLLNNVGPEDRVLIYFSGHGMDLQKGQGARRGFLLPVEADEQDLDATAISMGRIRELAGAMPAKHVLFIVDACYGGIGGLRSKGKTSFVTNQRLEDLTREPSRWLITAGGVDQEALEVDEWGHGLFTHFLLKGLDDQQLADRNQDKIITGSELWAYVEDVVYTEALLRGHKQRPELWRLAGDRGEFVFISAGVQSPGTTTTLLTETLVVRKGKEGEKVEIALLTKQEKRLRLIQAGTFIMGSNDGPVDENPLHKIELDAFYIDKYEITTNLYATFMRETARNEPAYWDPVTLVHQDDRPVVGVTWDDADTYCRHHGKRLPTEAEWEKAARGTDGRMYPWGNAKINTDRANYGKPFSNSVYADSLSPVADHQSGQSPYQVLNLAGNVMEWVADWYDDTYYATSPAKNPKGPPEGTDKVIRGGSWTDGPMNLQSTRRHPFHPESRSDNLGFRCVKAIP